MSNTHTKYGRADLNPAEWTSLGIFYRGTDLDLIMAFTHDVAEITTNLDSIGQVWEDVQTHANGGCASCGAGFLYGAVVHNTTTGDTIQVGGICLSVFSLDNRIALATRNAKAAADHARNARDGEAFAAEHGITEALKVEHYITESIANQLRNKGEISSKQIALVEKIALQEAEYAAKRAAREAELAEAPALEEGRYTIKGLVISTKAKDSDYGVQYKMLVELDNGNRVFGTIPVSIDNIVWDTHSTVMVQFDAAVERSRDDEHFGFYNRPTKASAAEVK